MNDEHISQFAAEKLALFLKEEMVPELLAKWQAHYRDCPQCREYVDRSTKNQALAAKEKLLANALIGNCKRNWPPLCLLMQILVGDYGTV